MHTVKTLTTPTKYCVQYTVKAHFLVLFSLKTLLGNAIISALLKGFEGGTLV